MRTIIATVGTSLLTNRDYDLTEDKRRPWHSRKYGDPLPAIDQISDYLIEADLRKASAETNTFRALPLRDDDQIVFLHSQTEEGDLCARALENFYTKSGYKVSSREITGLQYHEKTFAEKGLKALVDTVFDEIEKARSQKNTLVLCATGGFKAEIAFLNLAGILMGIEVYYIYESFEEVVLFPSFPLDWKLDVVDKNISFFEWIDSEQRNSHEVENRLHNIPEIRPLIYADIDGFSYLSAAGDLLFRAYKQAGRLPKAIWPEPSKMEPKEKNQISVEEHHRPKNWEKVVDQLLRIDCVERIRYDGSTPSKTRTSGVYYTDPKNGEIKAAYQRDSDLLPMVIGTTARGEDQCELVASYIGRKLKDFTK